MALTSESIGENLEFNVATASDMTIFFTGAGDNTKTSADDTATEKYVDNIGSIKRYQLRNDQTVQIVSINGVEFTEPITSVINKGIIEKLDTDGIFKMVIRTLVNNTNLKLRVR